MLNDLRNYHASFQNSSEVCIENTGKYFWGVIQVFSRPHLTMKRDVLAEVGLHRVAVLAGEHGPGPEVDCAGGAGHEAGCEDGGEGEEGGWPGHDIVEDTGGGASAAEATSDNTELSLLSTVHAAGRARATAPHSPHSPVIKVSAKFRGTQYLWRMRRHTL